jgi:hypothetical protein
MKDILDLTPEEVVDSYQEPEIFREYALDQIRRGESVLVTSGLGVYEEDILEYGGAEPSALGFKYARDILNQRLENKEDETVSLGLVLTSHSAATDRSLEALDDTVNRILGTREESSSAERLDSLREELAETFPDAIETGTAEQISHKSSEPDYSRIRSSVIRSMNIRRNTFLDKDKTKRRFKMHGLT